MPLCLWEFCLLTCFLKHRPLCLILSSTPPVLWFLSYSITLVAKHICQQLNHWDNRLLLAHRVTTQKRGIWLQLTQESLFPVNEIWQVWRIYWKCKTLFIYYSEQLLKIIYPTPYVMKEFSANKHKIMRGKNTTHTKTPKNTHTPHSNFWSLSIMMVETALNSLSSLLQCAQ